MASRPPQARTTASSSRSPSRSTRCSTTRTEETTEGRPSDGRTRHRLGIRAPYLPHFHPLGPPNRSPKSSLHCLRTPGACWHSLCGLNSLGGAQGPDQAVSAKELAPSALEGRVPLFTQLPRRG